LREPAAEQRIAQRVPVIIRVGVGVRVRVRVGVRVRVRVRARARARVRVRVRVNVSVAQRVRDHRAHARADPKAKGAEGPALGPAESVGPHVAHGQGLQDAGQEEDGADGNEERGGHAAGGLPGQG